MGMKRVRPLIEVLVALLLGLGMGAALMAMWGYDPWRAYRALFLGAFGDRFAIANTLSRATPLILTGLTFAVCLRGGLFNIGAQGQMIMGAVTAVAVSLWALPPGLHLLVAILAAMLAGALFSLPAALLKTTRGVHEVISTIMLNWIAFWLASYVIVTYLSDPFRGERTIQAAVGARFPLTMAGTDLTYALLASVLFALGIYWVLWYHPTGYELRAAGLNPYASSFAGIPPGRSMTLAFLLGGLAAGLAGATQVLGRFPYALTNTLSSLGTLGFDGIAVALVGRNHPLGVLASAVFFGALAAGATQMGFQANVPIDMIQIVQGVIILTVAIPELLRLVHPVRLMGKRAVEGPIRAEET